MARKNKDGNNKDDLAEEEKNQPWPGSNCNMVPSRVSESRTNQVAERKFMLALIFHMNMSDICTRLLSGNWIGYFSTKAVNDK